MELIKLFMSFIKIGFTSFGGMSMIPLIRQEMLVNGWMTQAEVLDIVAIAEMTPGPLGLNCATFAGMRTAGVIGAVVANLGVMTPTLTLCAVAAACFKKFSRSRALIWIMQGVRPATLGLLVTMLLLMLYENTIVGGGFYWQGAVIMLLIGFVMAKWNLSVIKSLALAALLGILLCG